MYRRMERFEKDGMASLFGSDPATDRAKRRGLEPAIRRIIVEPKAEHPALNNNEIKNIVYARTGRRLGKHTASRVISEEVVPLKLSRLFEPYHETPSRGEAPRGAVVTLHLDGWSVKAIASYLKVSRMTVYRVLGRWLEEGEEGLEDRRSGRPKGNGATVPDSKNGKVRVSVNHSLGVCMDPDAQEAAKRAELKERLEEIAGRKLNMTDEQLFSIFRPIASATYLTEKHDVPGGDDTWVTSERVTSAQSICTDSSLLDIGGLIVTGSNGRAVFRLSNFDRCNRHGFNNYSEPVNLLATPKGTSPVFMTMSHKLIYEPHFALDLDVEITASAWNPDGTAAANVPFYWRCRVPTSVVILRSQ